MARTISARMLRLGMNCWPPFVGAGIRVREIAPDFRRVRVEMPLGWRNRTGAGLHFGGSLFAMSDPFFALMVARNLSADYVVWDKSASIDFVAPGRGRVHAEFALAQRDLDTIVAMTAAGDKHLHLFRADVRDAEDLVIARIEKIVYVRRRRAPGEPPGRAGLPADRPSP